jgi:hypothetical protein
MLPVAVITLFKHSVTTVTYPHEREEMSCVNGGLNKAIKSNVDDNPLLLQYRGMFVPQHVTDFGSSPRSG